MFIKLAGRCATAASTSNLPCSIPLRHGERVETLDGVGGQRYAPTASPPGKRPGAHCTGGWGSRAGLAGEENLAALINRSRSKICL